MVGRGDERPDVMRELLDISRRPRKPQYDLADEAPLILIGADFDDDLPELRLSPLAASMLAKRIDAITKDHTARLAVLCEVWGEVARVAQAAGGGVPAERHRSLLSRATDRPLVERLGVFLAKQAARAAAAEAGGVRPASAADSGGAAEQRSDSTER